MNGSNQQQDAGQTSAQSTHLHPSKWPLSRRALVSWLGLSSSLGLSGVTYSSADANRQDSTPEGQTTVPVAGTLGLGIIGLHVADLAASLDFYRRLGLDLPTDIDLSGGAFRLELATGQVFFWESVAYTRQYFPGYEQGTGQRKVSLEFGFRSPEEVDAMYDALLADGYGTYMEPLSWGDIRYAGVIDPDDNQIALRFPLAS